MSACDICETDDIRELRTTLGTDAQQRLIVHQQCPRGHRWHLAFEEANNPLGSRETLMCDCPKEGRVKLRSSREKGEIEVAHP